MNPQLHVENVLKRCFEVYPSKGKEHRKFFKNLVKQGSMPENMAGIIVRSIEDPNCVYIVKSDELKSNSAVKHTKQIR
jgi:hypothetical protein